MRYFSSSTPIKIFSLSRKQEAGCDYLENKSICVSCICAQLEKSMFKIPSIFVGVDHHGGAVYFMPLLLLLLGAKVEPVLLTMLNTNRKLESNLSSVPMFIS